MSASLSKLDQYQHISHYGVLVEETVMDYDPYDRHGGSTPSQVVRYVQLKNEDELEKWVLNANAQKLKYRVIWAEPVAVELKAIVSITGVGNRQK